MLKFSAYFQEDVPISSEEHYRIRQVNIYYYLEDDSMSVIEPVVENSGIPQGKLIKRQRLPKNNVGDPYHWKDLNRGIDITIYGKTFRIVNCDRFTQVWCIHCGLGLRSSALAGGMRFITSSISGWGKTLVAVGGSH